MPDDVSLVGFDDLRSSMYSPPPLTTVGQPLYKIGSALGKTMLEIIALQPAQVELPGLSLVVRESVWRIT